LIGAAIIEAVFAQLLLLLLLLPPLVAVVVVAVVVPLEIERSSERTNRGRLAR
jgi:hypothetical protein